MVARKRFELSPSMSQMYFAGIPEDVDIDDIPIDDIELDEENPRIGYYKDNLSRVSGRLPQGN
jgi:hypothetical protein